MREKPILNVTQERRSSPKPHSRNVGQRPLIPEVHSLRIDEARDAGSKTQLAGLKKKLVDVEALQARLVETRAGLKAVIAQIETLSPGGDCFDNTEGVLASLREQPKLR